MALTVPVLEIIEKSGNEILGKHESWERILLGEIAVIMNGAAFESKDFSLAEGMPLIRIRDIVNGSTKTYFNGQYDEKYLVNQGDLLIGMDGDFNLARWKGPQALLNQRVCKIILNWENYNSSFLEYVLPPYLKAINNATSSVTVKHLSSKTIQEIPLPLPPLAEQQRIVAEIEKQFSRLDEAVAGLKRIQANLKKYRASVLKAAVEGGLTIEWRKQHPYNESAEQLLGRILQEHRKHWEQSELERMQFAGKSPKDDRWKQKYKEPIKPDVSELPDLPKGWIWCCAEQICDFITKGTTPSKSKLYDENGDIRFLKVYNLTFTGTLNYHYKPVFVDYSVHNGELQRSKVQTGDVLINIVGPPLGQVSLIPSEITEANINQAIARFRPLYGISNRYLMYVLMAKQVMQWAIKRAKTTVGQVNLTLELCRGLPLPLAPTCEQNQIVAEVERRLSIADEVEQQINASLKRAERMRQSILKKAFSGRLVPQESDDEPASVLLEKIRQAQSA